MFVALTGRQLRELDRGLSLAAVSSSRCARWRELLPRAERDVLGSSCFPILLVGRAGHGVSQPPARAGARRRRGRADGGREPAARRSAQSARFAPSHPLAAAAHEALRSRRASSVVVVPPASAPRTYASTPRAPRAASPAPRRRRAAARRGRDDRATRRRPAASPSPAHATSTFSCPACSASSLMGGGHVGRRLRHGRHAHAQAHQAARGDAHAKERFPARRSSHALPLPDPRGAAAPLRRSAASPSACRSGLVAAPPRPRLLLGALAFAGLGLLIAARAQNTKPSPGSSTW